MKNAPFFARFLENQGTLDRADAERVTGGRPKTEKYPSDDDEIFTEKYPSDDDEIFTEKYPSVYPAWSQCLPGNRILLTGR